MPERMRLIRNRAEVIYLRSSGNNVASSRTVANASPNDSSIPAGARHHYFEIAEKELIEEGKIARLTVV